jgi:hypothetical protein
MIAEHLLRGAGEVCRRHERTPGLSGEAPSIAGERSCQPAMLGHDSLLPVIRRARAMHQCAVRAGQTVEEVNDERAGMLLKDLHVRRNCVILHGPSSRLACVRRGCIDIPRRTCAEQHYIKYV